MNLKICSYNIKFGAFIFDDEIDTLIDDLNCDIICFQEFPLQHLKLWKTKLKSIGLTECLYQKTCETLLGTQQANAIFSRYELEDRHTLNLTYKGREVRKAQYCTVDLGKEKVFLLNTHLGLQRKERLYQMDKIVEVLNHHTDTEKMILLGDFNDWNNAGEKRLGGFFKEAHHELHGKCARSFPAKAPVFRLDRIYYRNLGPLSCKALRDKFVRGKSDHLPIKASFRL